MTRTRSKVAQLTQREKDRIIIKALEDLNFAAEISRYPSVLRAIIADKRILEKLEDPVFFAVLVCNQEWLINAEAHQKLLRDPSPRIVAVCGRGWGKSLVISLKAVCQYLFQYRKVDILIASSSHRQSIQIFSYLENHILANEILRNHVERHTRTLIKLKKPFEGKVEALPCSPNRLRGRHPDILLIDEASIVPAEMLSSELLPMLSKPRARLIMLGTPWGWDHPFRTAFLSTKFSTYHAPSTSSPLVSESQLLEWKELMTEDQWKREVEAQWIQPSDSYFPQI